MKVKEQQQLSKQKKKIKQEKSGFIVGKCVDCQSASVLIQVLALSLMSKNRNTIIVNSELVCRNRLGDKKTEIKKVKQIDTDIEDC